MARVLLTLSLNQPCIASIFDCKAILLQAWIDPWGSTGFSFPEFQDNRRMMVVLAHRPPVRPMISLWYSFLAEAESTPVS
jgi:hypothetical protein